MDVMANCMSFTVKKLWFAPGHCCYYILYAFVTVLLNMHQKFNSYVNSQVKIFFFHFPEA